MSNEHKQLPVINTNVCHQIQLLQKNIESLWNIAAHIKLRAQNTSVNEGLHSFFNFIRPKKTSKLIPETLELMVQISCFIYNRK
jgi:hypothetical protein